MNRRKKVKFWDHQTARTRRIRSPVAGDAKTSEYKSFQDLLGKSHTNQPPRYDNVSRNLDANDSMRKRNDPAADKIHGKRSISPTLVATPIAQRPLFSANTISPESHLKDKDRCKDKNSNIRSTIHKCMSDPWGSSFSPGPENKYKEIFSSKRENLIKLAAGTLACKADDIISNKSSYIQECMQRLNGGQKSLNPDEISKPRKKACTRYHSHSSMKSHNKDKEMQDLQWKTELSLFDQHYNQDDELFSPAPKWQLDLNFKAGEPEFSSNYNARLQHMPLKAPTLQSTEYYSDSMSDEEKQHKSRHKRKLEEQQIIPYGNSDISYDLYDHDISPKFRKEQDFDFPLLECNNYTNEEPEDSEGIDHSLRLALYNENMFRSSPSANCSGYEFDGEESDYGYGSCRYTSRKKYDDFLKKSEMIEMERYLSPDFWSCYDFDVGEESSFLDFRPEPGVRFSWL